MKDAERALGAEDLGPGIEAMTLLIDLSQELRGYDYFRSEDPIEAARVVVSDEVAPLWSQILTRRGFAPFAESAAPQLLRWESEFGWTRSGFGQVREQETSLAAVVERLLTVPDHWVAFTDRCLQALDAVAGRRATRSPSARPPTDRGRDQRTRDLAEWHFMLIDRLFGSTAEGYLDRLADHGALGGPDLLYFRAQVAERRGEVASARRLATEALDRLPGHQGYLTLATEPGYRTHRAKEPRDRTHPDRRLT